MKKLEIVQMTLIIPWFLFLICVPINIPVITIVHFISLLVGIVLLLEYIKTRIELDEKWEDKWEDFKYEVHSFYPLVVIRDFYYSIKNGIPNLFKWSKVIWNDRDWDSSFVFKILYFKFEKMEKFFNSDKAWSKNAKIDAKRIMVAKNLCKRISEEKYLQNALVEHDKKFGDNFNFIFESIEDKPGFSRLVDNRSEAEQKSFSRAGKHSDYMKKQDIDYLFKFLNKHLTNWWD